MQTFVFTDIEASTRLWEEHPEAMATALSLHDEIVRSTILENHGHVLKTTGDGFVAVFAAALDAAVATVQIQRRLDAEDWSSTGPLRARIGVHSGETGARDGDFFGPTMNRTARIMAAGHGGQILLSGATAARVADALPSGTVLSDLGSHRLKDLTDPEHLFQLAALETSTDFPELRTLEARPNNLPRQGTEFLGRAEELTSVRSMLESDSTRLVTLAGPGGAGKTRLALQVGADLSNQFDDGVFFVDLSSERDPEAAFETVVRTLELPATGEMDPLSLLKARLRDRNMLLILDNFEQVISAAPGVNELLQSCPQLRVIVTSRETLRVRMERVFPVPPLSLADPQSTLGQIAESEAVQLFVDRARMVRPDFALTDQIAPVVAEICLRLDGLPLAVELAAARMTLFSPVELRDRLEERLDVLGAGGRDLPDRQRTLWGAIAWSYELLDEGERDVFEMMSVFSTARLDALEGVAVQSLRSGLVLDNIASLVDKSLVRSESHEGATRFSMLAMIREYAASQLAERPDRRHEIQTAHAAYYSSFAVDLGERLRGPGRAMALSDLEAEIGNLRNAWRFWVEGGDLEQLFDLLDTLWALHEARGWYHAAIELARDVLGVLATSEATAELEAEELILRTSLARALMAVRGYDIEVERAFTQALELAESAGTPQQRFPVLRALASYYTLSGNLPRALETGHELLELGEASDDQSMLMEGHYVVGMATSFTDIDRSVEHLEIAIGLYDRNPSDSNRFRLGPNTGVVARMAAALPLWFAGEAAKAEAMARRALSLAREIDHPFSLAYALYHNGYLASLRSRFRDCLECARELRGVASANEYAIWETLSTVLEGVALSGLGRPEEGLEKTEAGIQLYAGLTTPPVFWPFVLGLRSVVHARAGLMDRAIELIDEALEATPVGVPGMLMMRGDFLSALPNPDLEEVGAHYMRELEQARALRLRLVQLQCLTRILRIRVAPGEESELVRELAMLYDGLSEAGADEDDLEAAKAAMDV